MDPSSNLYFPNTETVFNWVTHFTEGLKQYFYTISKFKNV